MTLDRLILIAGLLHLGLMLAASLTPGKLDLKNALRPLPAMTRHLIWVHAAFIFLVIVGFGAITVANAHELAAGGRLARSFCALLAIFWGTRLTIQLTFFDGRPYLTNWFFKVGYHCLGAVFAYLAAVYGFAALRP